VLRITTYPPLKQSHRRRAPQPLSSHAALQRGFLRLATYSQEPDLRLISVHLTSALPRGAGCTNMRLSPTRATSRAGVSAPQDLPALDADRRISGSCANASVLEAQGNASQDFPPGRGVLPGGIPDRRYRFSERRPLACCPFRVQLISYGAFCRALLPFFSRPRCGAGSAMPSGFAGGSFRRFGCVQGTGEVDRPEPNNLPTCVPLTLPPPDFDRFPSPRCGMLECAP